MRIGVIGCGGQARQAILPSLRFGGFELAAVCDVDHDLARQVGRAFGAGASYRRYQDMLDKEELDVVAVVGPPELHVEAGLAVLASGRHLFVEKPPALTADAASKLATAAGQLHVMVGFQKRHARAYRLAQRISRTPEFGRPSMLRLTYSHVHVSPLHDHLAFMSVHALDLARFFLGEVVAGSVHRSARGPYSVIAATLEHRSGTVSMLSLSALEPRLQETLELAGDSTLLRVRDLVEVSLDRRAPEWEDCYGTDLSMSSRWRPDFTIPVDDNNSLVLQGYAGEMAELGDALRSGRRPEGDIHDAIATMRLVDTLSVATMGFSSFSFS